MKSFWVYCGWMIDGNGAGIRERVLLKIQGQRIALMEAGIPPVDASPDNEPFVNLSEGTVIPPLVDTHVHLTLSGTGDPDIRDRQLRYTFEQAQSVILENLEETFRAGIFAVRDGGDAHGHTLCFKAHSLKRIATPVTIKAAGMAWHAAGRYGKFIGRSPAHGERLDACVLRQEADCDHIKIVNSGLNSLKVFGLQTPPQFSLEELTRAFDIARKRGFRIMVHANGEQAVREALIARCDSIEHGFFMGRENLSIMRDQQVHWVPTVMTMKGHDFEKTADNLETEISLRNFDHQMEQIRLAAEMGVPIALGTDSGSPGVHHGRTLTEEFAAFLVAGLSLPQAVETASKNGARLLGMGEGSGTIGLHMPASFLFYRCRPDRLHEKLATPQLIFCDGVTVSDTILRSKTRIDPSPPGANLL